MDAIRTENFQLTKNEYFKISLVRMFKTQWVFFIIIPLIFSPYFFNAPDIAYIKEMFFMLIPYVSGLIVFVIIIWTSLSWWMAYNKKNAFYYRKQYCIFDDEGIHIFCDNGETSKINISSILKVKTIAGCYLLYVAITTVIILPSSAFLSPFEVGRFENFLKSKGLR